MQEMQERPYGATDETTVLEVYVALGTSQTCRGCRGNWTLPLCVLRAIARP